MNQPRASQVATVIAGKVLVAGGVGIFSEALSNAELYDPSANRWLSAAPLNEARIGATGTPLANGVVLVAGGNVPSAEL